MYLFVSNADVPGEPAGRRGILEVAWAHRQFDYRRSVLRPGFAVVVIDQAVIANQDLCADLWNVRGKRDFRNLEKYYVTVPGNRLWRRGGWVSREQGEYAPTADVDVTPADSPEWRNVEDNLAAVLARLNQIQANVVGANLNQTQAAVRDLAQHLERTLRFLYRHLRPS